MRYYLTITLIIICLGGLSAGLTYSDIEFDLEEETSLRDVSHQTGVPIKTMAEYLGVPYSEQHEPLINYGLDETNIQEALYRFDKDKRIFYWGVVVVGMLIVFSSLIITALVVYLLKFTSKKKEATVEKKQPERAKKRIVSASDMNSKEIAAASLTLYLHEIEREEQNKLLLTWRRANISMWRATNSVNMPNQIYQYLKGEK